MRRYSCLAGSCRRGLLTDWLCAGDQWRWRSPIIAFAGRATKTVYGVRRNCRTALLLLLGSRHMLACCCCCCCDRHCLPRAHHSQQARHIIRIIRTQTALIPQGCHQHTYMHTRPLSVHEATRRHAHSCVRGRTTLDGTYPVTHPPLRRRGTRTAAHTHPFAPLTGGMATLSDSIFHTTRRRGHTSNCPANAV